MWSQDYLPKSLFRGGFLALLAVLIWVMVQAVSFYVNRHLPADAQAWCRVIDQQWGLHITFESLHYSFPNHITCKHLLVHTTDKKIPLVAIAAIDVALEPTIKKIMSRQLCLNWKGLKAYADQHPASLDTLIKLLPQEKLRLLLSNKQFSIDATLGAQHIDAKGTWGEIDKYTYTLSGQIGSKGINVNKLTIQNKDISLDLWGRWRDTLVNWNGFIFYKGFYILDIIGHLNIEDHILNLHSLNFNINGDPVHLHGQCSKTALWTCHADLNLWRQPQHQNRATPLKDIRLHLDIKKTMAGLLLAGDTDLNFLVVPSSSFDWQSAHLDFKHLGAQLINTNLLRLKINDLVLSWVDNQQHRLPVDGVLASIDWQTPHASIALTTKMYQGDAEGHFSVDTDSWPWIINGEGNLNDLDLNGLNKTYALFKLAQGRLWSHFNLLSLKDWKLTTYVVIHQGEFDDDHFLPWLSQTLQMPGLEPISGIDLSCNIAIDGHAKMFHHLKMYTHDIDVNGFFDLNDEDMVSSLMGVKLSKELLKTSALGRSLMGVVKDAWKLPFEFRLSGKFQKMNFQWESSPLKTKVSEHIFGFVQRAIDRRVDTQTTTYPLLESNIH